jgi:hypothetical protein
MSYPATLRDDCAAAGRTLQSAPVSRLDWLAEAQRLERLWDNVAGADNCPARRALVPQIKAVRAEYDRMTREFIVGGAQ